MSRIFTGKKNGDPQQQELLFLIFSYETFEGEGYCQVSIVGYFMPVHLRE